MLEDIVGDQPQRLHSLDAWTGAKELAWQRQREQDCLLPEPGLRGAFLDRVSIGLRAAIVRVLSCSIGHKRAEVEVDAIMESNRDAVSLYEIAHTVSSGRELDLLYESGSMTGMGASGINSLVAQTYTSGSLKANAASLDERHLFLSEDSLRKEGQDVSGREGDCLPYVRGEFVENGRERLMSLLDVEFKDLTLARAALKSSVFFGLSMLLHAQMDHNKRVNSAFFDVLIARSSDSVIGDRCRNINPEVLRMFLKGMNNSYRIALFRKYFSDIANKPYFSRFVLRFTEYLFSHHKASGEDFFASMNVYSDLTEDMFSAIDDNSISPYLPRREVKLGDVEHFLMIVHDYDIDANDLFERLESFESSDDQELYFDNLLSIAEGFVDDLQRDVLPVIEQMMQNGSRMIYYYYQIAYKEFHGQDPNGLLKPFVEIALELIAPGSYGNHS